MGDLIYLHGFKDPLSGIHRFNLIKTRIEAHQFMMAHPGLVLVKESGVDWFIEPDYRVALVS